MKLHHIGIVSKDLKKSIQHHGSLFNLHPITKIVEDPIQKVSVVMLSSPEKTGVPIELVSPLSEESPVSNLLKKDVHLYHICYSVENIESALKKARKKGATIISEPSPAKLYPGRRIAFIYTPDNYIVEFLEEKSQKPQRL